MNFTSSSLYEVFIECNERYISSLEIKVLINDNDWMIGANHIVQLSNNATHVIYPFFSTFEGVIDKIIENVFSEELNNTRNIIVYLPPSYHENILKIHKNILIMHDGQNLFDPSTSAFGKYILLSLSLTHIHTHTQSLYLSLFISLSLSLYIYIYIIHKLTITHSINSLSSLSLAHFLTPNLSGLSIPAFLTLSTIRYCMDVSKCYE